MEIRAKRRKLAGPLCTLLASAVLAGCEGSPSAVERLESIPGPVVTVIGAIDVDSQGDPGEIPEVLLRFYEPPDTTMVEERQLLWSPTYRLEFSHDAVCRWSFDVTIWDGRRSERKPVLGDPGLPCQGFVQGPDFWFP